MGDAAFLSDVSPSSNFRCVPRSCAITDVAFLRNVPPSCAIIDVAFFRNVPPSCAFLDVPRSCNCPPTVSEIDLAFFREAPSTCAFLDVPQSCTCPPTVSEDLNLRTLVNPVGFPGLSPQVSWRTLPFYRESSPLPTLCEGPLPIPTKVPRPSRCMFLLPSLAWINFGS